MELVSALVKLNSVSCMNVMSLMRHHVSCDIDNDHSAVACVRFVLLKPFSCMSLAIFLHAEFVTIWLC